MTLFDTTVEFYCGKRSRTVRRIPDMVQFALVRIKMNRGHKIGTNESEIDSKSSHVCGFTFSVPTTLDPNN